MVCDPPNGESATLGKAPDLRSAAFDAMPIMSFVVDAAGLLACVNSFGARTLGYKTDDLLGQPWHMLSPESDRDAVRANAESCLRELGLVMHWETRKARRDGELIQVRETGHAALVNNRPLLFITSEDVTQRKGLEQALIQSERYLSEAQRLSHTGSWTSSWVATPPITTHYSDEAFRLFGFDPKRGKPPQLEETMHLIHPDDRARVVEELGEVIRDRAEYSQDYRIVLSDGSIRHLQSIGHPVIGPEGQLLEYFGTVMDVTERKRAERRLIVQTRITQILSEALTLKDAMPRILQALCETLAWHVGVYWQVDQKEKVLRCTTLWSTPSLAASNFEAASFARLVAIGDDLPGTAWESGVPVSVRDVGIDPGFARAKAASRLGLRGALAFPVTLGSEILGIVENFSHDLCQADSALLTMVSTIGAQIGQFTKRAAAVEELRLRVGMLQHIPVAAWSVMSDGTPDIVNALWNEYTGQTPEYVNSHPEAWMSTIHPEDREQVSQTYWHGIRSGKGFTMEARFLRALDREYRWHLTRAVTVHDSDGKIVRLVGTSTDIHDLRLAQEELRATETKFAHMTRVMAMGELAASIAHEVNQPLGAIVTSAGSATRWLSARPPQMERARRALERISNDGKRAAAVIQRIRSLMKRQPPHKEWLDFNELILEVLSLTQRELRRNDIKVETRLKANLPPLYGDRIQLQQVLLNLIVNSIEAMGDVVRRRLLTIISTTEGSENVRVEVRDTGTGLKPDNVAHLFEPFYTTKADGLGIGLSISRTIVEAHGGHLCAGPTASIGTAFWLILPVHESLP